MTKTINFTNSALVNAKKKIQKRSQKIPQKSKKVGRKKPRKHYYKESEESSKQQPNQAVDVQIGVVPSTGSEMLLRKNNEKCVENLSDA